MKICLICVGNELMLDDGLGVEVFRQIDACYELPENVDLECAGCMTLDMVTKVGAYDLMISVDDIDGTDAEPGTIFRYTPDDIARRGTPMGSLHELKIADLFDAAALIGLACEGLCRGMQVENASPADFVMGLTPPVLEKLPYLVDTVIAELVTRGCAVRVRETGELVVPGYHHRMVETGDA
jgi:hydrogenase maturation protease